MNYAVIENGIVVNIIKWDGKTPLGINLELVECDGQTVDIGFIYENGLFFKE
jgi:hypothetical protein